MTQIDELMRLRTLRERNIRSRIAELERERISLTTQRAELVESIVQWRNSWKAVAAASETFNACEFGRHLEKLSSLYQRDAELVAQIGRLRGEEAECLQREEVARDELRRNLRGQEKFRYLSEQLFERP